jgi:DNA-binding transcriptional MerR regulator
MQSQKIRMGKKEFRIGDLAKELKVKKFVIRFWEKEFGFKSHRSEGGQRFYTQDDFLIFSQIKNLLYSKGFTIAGAKKQILESGLESCEKLDMVATPEIKDEKIVVVQKALDSSENGVLDYKKYQDFLNKLKIFKKDLIKFKSFLK